MRDVVRHDLQVGPFDLHRGLAADAAAVVLEVFQHRLQAFLFGFGEHRSGFRRERVGRRGRVFRAAEHGGVFARGDAFGAAAHSGVGAADGSLVATDEGGMGAAGFAVLAAADPALTRAGRFVESAAVDRVGAVECVAFFGDPGDVFIASGYGVPATRGLVAIATGDRGADGTCGVFVAAADGGVLT